MEKKQRGDDDGYRGMFEDEARVVSTGKQTKVQRDAVKRLNKFLSDTNNNEPVKKQEGVKMALSKATQKSGMMEKR